MPQFHQGGATSPTTRSLQGLTLLQIVRSAEFYPILRALLNNEIARPIFQGALPYFLYPLGGDETLVNEDELTAITQAIGASIGIPRLRARPKVLRGLEGQTTLVLPEPAKQACFMELLALMANLSVEDMAALPPPVDVQERAWEEQRRQGSLV